MPEVRTGDACVVFVLRNIGARRFLHVFARVPRYLRCVPPQIEDVKKMKRPRACDVCGKVNVMKPVTSGELAGNFRCPSCRAVYAPCGGYFHDLDHYFEAVWHVRQKRGLMNDAMIARARAVKMTALT